jgi:hypothetical protein
MTKLPQAALRAAAGAAMLLFAVSAAAQHVLCCSMLIDVKGKWTGASRDCAGTLRSLDPQQMKLACDALGKLPDACPAAQPPCAPRCDLLARLIGRQKGLYDASLAHRKGRDASEKKRSEARDQLWGKGEGLKFEGGSISRFGQASLDSLLLAGGGATGVGQAYGKATSAYDEAKGWAQTGWGLGSDPLAVENWADLGEKLLAMEADAILKERSGGAIRAMNQHFQKTGNYIGAQNVYKQRWGGYGNLKNLKDSADKVTGAAGKLADGLGTLVKLYQSADQLANDLQSWTDNFRDQKMAEREIEKAEAEAARLQEQIDRLRAQCEGKPAARLFPGARFIQVADGKPNRRASDDADWAAIQAGQKAAGLVRQVRNTLSHMDGMVGRQVVAPLSPWLARTSREARPRELLLHLVKESRAPLEEFGHSLARLTSQAQAALNAVQGIPRR